MLNVNSRAIWILGVTVVAYIRRKTIFGAKNENVFDGYNSYYGWHGFKRGISV